jgi:hypothetical protein
MWWLEHAKQERRNQRYRDKRARRIVDRQLKNYCTALVSDAVPCAETLLHRALRTHDLNVAPTSSTWKATARM